MKIFNNIAKNKLDNLEQFKKNIVKIDNYF